MGGQSKNDHTLRIAIQPMNQQRIGEQPLYAGQQTIGKMFTAPRYRKQAGRFVDRNNMGVFVQNGHGVHGGIVGCNHGGVNTRFLGA